MPQTQPYRTRFAPSPTGLLHVGNAFSALQCHHWAQTNHAELLLRIEDIDFTRCRPQYTQYILEDLQWLDIACSGEHRIQSEHFLDYQQALNKLISADFVYPCFCTRKHIQQAIERMGIAPHQDDIADTYPNICRDIPDTLRQQRMAKEPFAWRLHMKNIRASLSEPLTWSDEHTAYSINLNDLGDIIIARKDIGISYHLAVVVDDALQGITHAIRGDDLRSSTAIHRLLQALLEQPSPIYIHHPLLLDSNGKRLAKRNHATTLQSLRLAGMQAEQLCAFLSQDHPSWPFNEHHHATYISKQLGSML